jgi:hypothetical protein
MSFGDFSVASQIGLAPRVQTQGDTGVANPTERSAIGDLDTMGLFSPANPLTWFAAFLLVTVGAASAAGSVRLGKIKLSATAGK